MGMGLTARRVLAGYAAWMALLVVARYAFAGSDTETDTLIEVSGVAAMLAGVAMNRPARYLPWLLLAAGSLADALGDLSAHVLAAVSHVPVPFPSFADAIYLAQYPLYVAGLTLFIRIRSAERDVRSMIDALILMVGPILLAWVFLVVPDATVSSFSPVQRIVSVAYPVGNLLVLVTLARLLAPGTARGPSAVLLALGAVCAIASDVAYGRIMNSGHPHPHPGALLSLGFLAWYIAWGAAALHPSMTELTRSARQRIPDATPASVVVLMLASLIPSAYLLFHAFEKHDGVQGVVAVACGVL
jgi:hypothetical protein